MPIPITKKTVVATYHHARQSDLDPTVEELRGWAQILDSNYSRILPREMAAHNLDPADPVLVDLCVLLAELTEDSGVLARARRGCAVVAGLIGGRAPFSDAAALAGAAGVRRRAPRTRGARKRATTRGKRKGASSRRRSSAPS